MHFPLPRDYERHLTAVPVSGLQPHSIALARDRAAALRYNRMNQQIYRGNEQVPFPIFVDVGGARSSEDGDHRTWTMYDAGATIVPVALYNLEDPADAERIVEWKHEMARRAFAQEGFGEQYLRHLKVQTIDQIVSDIRRMRAFVAAQGVHDFSAFSDPERWLDTKEALEVQHGVLWADYFGKSF